MVFHKIACLVLDPRAVMFCLMSDLFSSHEHYKFTIDQIYVPFLLFLGIGD